MSPSQPSPVFRGYVTRSDEWHLCGTRIVLTWPHDIDALLDLPLTHERFARNEYMPYWAQPWPASALLAEYVLSNGRGSDPEAIELGCGVGLAGVAAAMAGWRVTASDYDEDAIAFAKLNATNNQVTLAGTLLLDFVTSGPPRRYDRILASDLLYERRLSEPLARWIAAGLTPDGQALVSDPNRSAAEQFAGLLAEHGLRADLIPVSTTAPADLLTRGRIWRITHK